MVYASQVPSRLTEGMTLVYDVGRHITSNNGHGRYAKQDHAGREHEVKLWCFGGQFLNRPWLVQVVDNCDFRQALAVASELLAGAGTNELSEQTQTNNPQ